MLNYEKIVVDNAVSARRLLDQRDPEIFAIEI